MYKKDFIESEVQKVADAISSILGLKKEGKLDEALEVSEQTLKEQFDLDKKILDNGSVEEFRDELFKKNLSVSQMDALAQILFEYAHPFQDTEEGISKARKAALVLTLLETEHRQQSLQNLSRREAIDNFLSNRQYE